MHSFIHTIPAIYHSPLSDEMRSEPGRQPWALSLPPLLLLPGWWWCCGQDLIWVLPVVDVHVIGGWGVYRRGLLVRAVRLQRSLQDLQGQRRHWECSKGHDNPFRWHIWTLQRADEINLYYNCSWEMKLSLYALNKRQCEGFHWAVLLTSSSRFSSCI